MWKQKSNLIITELSSSSSSSLSSLQIRYKLFLFIAKSPKPHHFSKILLYCLGSSHTISPGTQLECGSVKSPLDTSVSPNQISKKQPMRFTPIQPNISYDGGLIYIYIY